MDENYELILYLLSKHYPEQDFESMGDFEVYKLFYDHYNLEIDSFDDLVKDLLPLCSEGESPLTGKKYRGFGTNSMWLVKVPTI